MTLERWQEIKAMIKSKFSIEEEKKESLGQDVPGEKEMVIFTSNLGKIKLEWITKPRTLGEKTIYSRRIGSQVKVDKVYDENEIVCYLKAYRQTGDEWREIEAENII